MLLVVSRSLLAAGFALLALWCAPTTARSQPPASDPGHVGPVEAQFRGCDAAGWCRFWVESAHPASGFLHRVRPDGVAPPPGDDALAIAVRDRLNAVLASMIHQHKRIVLHDLRELDDGTFAATVTVNGADLAADPVLSGLREPSASGKTER